MISTNVRYIAVDQYGKKIILRTDHPRKELLNVLDRKKAAKMYVDTPTGAEHIGYVIDGRWFVLYAVEGQGLRGKEGKAK